VEHCCQFVLKFILGIFEMPETVQPGPSADHSWISSFYPAFDGLRGVACLMVVFLHYLMAAVPDISLFELWTGVDLFFVLSGFLITGILFDTVQHRRYFRDFYIRRSLRILPLSYGVFFLILVLTPFLHLGYSQALWTNPMYIINIYVKHAILIHRHNPTVVDVPALHTFLSFGHLWSLCVEEQFYIVWPLVVWFVRSRKALMNVCVAGIVLTITLRTYLYLHDPATADLTHYLYNSTYTRCDSLLCGAWLGLWLRGARPTPVRLKKIALTLFGGGFTVTAALLLAFHSDLSGFNPVMYTAGYTFVALCACGVLLRSLDSTSRLHRAMLNPLLRNVGKISYGLYFLHDIVLEPVKQLATVLRPYHLALMVVPIGFAFSYALATLSFRFWEAPFLKLKNILAPADGSAPLRMPSVRSDREIAPRFSFFKPGRRKPAPASLSAWATPASPVPTLSSPP
jgi:peptidoglycan/LPS O-acetylase OafA/YrhL